MTWLRIFTEITTTGRGPCCSLPTLSSDGRLAQKISPRSGVCSVGVLNLLSLKPHLLRPRKPSTLHYTVQREHYEDQAPVLHKSKPSRIIATRLATPARPLEQWVGFYA